MSNSSDFALPQRRGSGHSSKQSEICFHPSSGTRPPATQSVSHSVGHHMVCVLVGARLKCMYYLCPWRVPQRRVASCSWRVAKSVNAHDMPAPGPEARGMFSLAYSLQAFDMYCLSRGPKTRSMFFFSWCVTPRRVVCFPSVWPKGV